MNYYQDQDAFFLCAQEVPGLTPVPRQRALEAGGLTLLYQGDPAVSRGAFAATSPALLAAPAEGPWWVDSTRLPQPQSPVDPALAALLEAGGVKAVNMAWPGWRERALSPAPPKRKLRLNLLALGDVGGTLLIGLKLLGRDCLASIGICDVSDNMAQRWEYEMNQTTYPWDYDALPPVEVIGREELFDGDVFVFCASKGIPPVGAQVQDVRMIQLEGNAAILGDYAGQAREKKFQGLFAVVSDPVDPLCRVAFLESNRAPDGTLDFLGLRPEQIQGFGLGVMNGRAAYYAKKDPRFASFLTEGRAYGPHGQGLWIANSVEHYDDALSAELTKLAVEANLRTRETGFKPYVAPALSSGAISLTLTLEGKWHYGSTFLGGAFLGAKNRLTTAGLELEALPLPQALYSRVEQAWETVRAVV